MYKYWITFKYGDKTVVAGFINAEGSPFGFSKLATHSCKLKENQSDNLYYYNIKWKDECNVVDIRNIGSLEKQMHTKELRMINHDV